MSSGVLYLTKLVVSVLSCLVSKRDQVPLDYAIHFMHPLYMLLPKPDPYDEARPIILFLGAASLVTVLFKLFSPRGDMVDKENKKE